jgi:hypothetical protein
VRQIRKVQPLVAIAQAFLAAVYGGWEFAQFDLVEVGAEFAHPIRAL